jgi:hypothetical protein
MCVDLHPNLTQFAQFFAFLFDPLFTRYPQVYQQLSRFLLGQLFLQNLG